MSTRKEYYPGKGCKCAAYNADECGCSDVDWTPKEVYILRDKVKLMQAVIEAARTVVDNYYKYWHGNTDIDKLRDVLKALDAAQGEKT